MRRLALKKVAPAEQANSEVNGEVWELSLGEIEPDTGRLLEKVWTSSDDLGPSKITFDERNVLYSRMRPYLNKVLLPDTFGVGSSELVPLRPDPEQIDRSYLTHYLRSPEFVSFANNNTSGANLPRMSMRAFWKHEIPLPPLDEQRHIAAVLDRADALRAKRRRAQAMLDDLLRSAFMEMFGDLVANSHNWSTLDLGDLIADGPQNGLYRHSSDYGSGTPIVRIDSFYDGSLINHDQFKRVQIEEDVREKYQLRPGDVLVNRVNSREYLGKSAFVHSLQEPTVYESNMMRLAVDTSRIRPLFLVRQMRSPHVRRQILTRSKDSVNQSSINQGDVASLSIRVPPVALQDRYEQVWHHMRELASKMSDNLTDDLYHALAQRAFRGELTAAELAA